MSLLESALALIVVVALGLAIVFLPIGLAVLVYNVTRRVRPHSEQPRVGPVPPEQRRRVERLLAQGQRREAIRAAREGGNFAKLSQATAWVDAVARGEADPPGLDASDEAHVRALVSRGKRIEAVIFVRQRAGYGVADADATVRRLTDT